MVSVSYIFIALHLHSQTIDVFNDLKINRVSKVSDNHNRNNLDNHCHSGQILYNADKFVCVCVCRYVSIHQDSCPVRGILGSNEVCQDTFGAAISVAKWRNKTTFPADRDLQP